MMQHRFRSDQEAGDNVVVQEWGSLKWLAGAELTGSDITLGEVVIRPGQSNPRHCHDNCEEVLYLLRGRLTHTFADGSVDMQRGDTLVLPPGVMHNATSTGEEDAVMIVAYSDGDRQFRKE